MSESTLAQNIRRNVNHWIGVSPLYVGDIKPSGVINDTSWTTKRQWQLWGM